MDDLRQVAEECATRWSLVLEKPLESEASLVIPAGDAVLKVNADWHFEAEFEVDALALYEGRRAARAPDGALPAGDAPLGRGGRDRSGLRAPAAPLSAARGAASLSHRRGRSRPLAARATGAVPGVGAAGRGARRLPYRGPRRAPPRQPGSARRQRPARRARAVARDRPEAARRRAGG